MWYLLKIQTPGPLLDFLNQNLLGRYQEFTCLTLISSDSNDQTRGEK